MTDVAVVVINDTQLEKLAALIAEKLGKQEVGTSQEWFSINEVAAGFGVAAKTVRTCWIGNEKLEATKERNGRLKVHKDAILKFANDTGKIFG